MKNATDDWLTSEEEIANARLFLSAPDLFEALFDCYSGLQYILGRYGELEGVGFDRAISKAKEAMLKAGVSPE